MKVEGELPLLSRAKLPEGWKVLPLRYAVDFRSDQLSSSTAPSYQFRYVDIGSVSHEEGISNYTELTYSKSPSRARKLVSAGDTIISTVRTYLRSIATIYDDRDVIVSTGFSVLRPRLFEPDYLGYLAKSDIVCSEIERRSWGVAYPAVSENHIGLIYVPLPPLDEQVKISAHLNSVTSNIGRAIDLLQQELGTLEQLKKSLIYEAVTKGLDPTVPTKPSGVEWIGDIPEHWAVQRLKFVLNNFDYLRMPVEASERSTLGDTLFPFYGASGVIDHIDRFNVEGESILVGEDGANLVSRNLPIAYFAEGRYWVNNHAHILRPKAGSMRYYFYALEACDYAPFITGSAQPKLSQRNLNDVYLPVPLSMAEQEQIAVELQRSLEDISRVFDLKLEQLDLLKQRRQSIIFEYVTGKRRVNEVA